MITDNQGRLTRQLNRVYYIHTRLSEKDDKGASDRAGTYNRKPLYSKRIGVRERRNRKAHCQNYMKRSVSCKLCVVDFLCVCVCVCVCVWSCFFLCGSRLTCCVQALNLSCTKSLFCAQASPQKEKQLGCELEVILVGRRCVLISAALECSRFLCTQHKRGELTGS
jgi:hypothetical protein